MLPSRWIVVLGLGLAMVAGGCASGPGQATCTYCTSELMALASTAVEMDRGKIELDVSQVKTPEEVEALLDRPSRPSQYYGLTARQCQCLAAVHAPLANALDRESDLKAESAERCETAKARAAALKADLLAYKALDERNSAAADALKLFFRLAEAEAHRDLLHASRQEIDRAIEDLEELEGKGFTTDEDGGALRRRKIDVSDRRVQLDQSISKLNAGLRQMFGAPADDPTPIWPMVELAVTVDPVDVDSAVAEGMQCRADVGALQYALACADTVSAASLRQVLAQLYPALGSSSPPMASLCAMLGLGGQGNEKSTRKQQIVDMLAARQEVASAEIRQACEAVGTCFRRIALAKQTRDHWRSRLDDLEARRNADGVSSFDVGVARLELFQAEADLVSRVVDLRLAEVELKRAQGVLPIECGYGVPEGTCRCEPCK